MEWRNSFVIPWCSGTAEIFQNSILKLQATIISEELLSCFVIPIRSCMFQYFISVLPPTVSPVIVRNVTVTTANGTALLVRWDALQKSQLSHYTIYYSAFSKELNKVVDRFTKVIPFMNTSEIVNIRELMAGVRHEFQVTASLEIEGELYEGEKSVAATLVFGKP